MAVGRGIAVQDNDALNMAIQRFMGEPLTIRAPVDMQREQAGRRNAPETHGPFFYDYKDYEAAKDYRNYFITKCLATGGGQCNSMPGVYLCLAEALGARATLSFAPQHSFIKFRDKTGAVRNYEPTSGWEISDSWYQDNMFISSEAVRSGIYLDTLSREQLIANCICELAAGYTRACPLITDKGAFVMACLQSAKPYFPKYNNLTALFLYSDYLNMRLKMAMAEARIPDAAHIPPGTEADDYLQELAKNETFIKKMGYRDMPAGMYEELLKEHEFKNRLQQAKGLDGKRKRSLFTIHQ